MSILQKLSGNDEKLRKQQIEIVSMLNRWYQVKEDLLFAFEKSAISEIAEPSKTYLNEFVARVRGGLEIVTALKMMADSFDDTSFRYVLKQLEFNLKYRGNTGEVLDDLESQMMKLDEEFTRRKISTSKDRRIIKCIFIINPLFGVVSMCAVPAARQFFIHTEFGKMSLVLVFCLYLAGITLYFLAGRKSRNA